MKKVIVTGANRGIGLELCRLYSERGDQVTALCRSHSNELRDLDFSVLEGIEITDSGAIGGLAQTLRGHHFDCLIVNAGILEPDRLASLDYESIERQFRVNAMGSLRVVEALIPNLPRGSCIALMTSRMGSIEDNSSGGYYGYRMSKAALNIMGKSLSIDLAPVGISVAILHPGMVGTQMTQGHGIHPALAAANLIERIDGLRASDSGTFWHAEGEVLPW